MERTNTGISGGSKIIHWGWGALVDPGGTAGAQPPTGSNSFIFTYIFIGRSEGSLPACPPNRIQIFHFRIHFCQKVPTSEVGAPQWLGTPQQKILDLPLVSAKKCPCCRSVPPQQEILDLLLGGVLSHWGGH